MLADIRYALRGFRRSPGFVLVAVVSLALGIGANTAIFSLVNAVLLRTLPVREPNRLIIFTLSPPERRTGNAISHALYQQIRDKNTVLEGFAAVTSAPMTLSGVGIAERLNGQLVSGNFFETLGVSALIGRVFTPGDDRVPGSPPVCVISYAFWLRRFGADPNLIGRNIQINGQPFTVLGVTPKKYIGLNQSVQTDISIPLMAAGMSKYVNWLQTFGRLKPGVSVAQAQASLDVLYHQFETRLNFETTELRYGKPSDIKILLQSGGQGLIGLRRQYERPLLLLMVVVGLVLLIACANVANLLLARASGRAREIAVRLALGAGRARLVRQLLAESALLTISGAAIGIAFAYCMDRALVALAPGQNGAGAPVIDVNPDWRVLLFTLGISILVSVLSGIAPAIQSTRPDLGPSLKGNSGVRAPGRLSFTNALVVGQVALSLVLLIGAGLFLRSLHNLKSIDPGFDPEHMVVLRIEPASFGYSLAGSQNLFDTLVERASRMPGVVSAGPSNISPLSGDFSIGGIGLPGQRPHDRKSSSIAWVGPDFFKTLRTTLSAGRVFTEQDGRASKVAIVNEKLAALLWPQESPIGKHVIVGSNVGDCEIVGLVKDVKSDSLREGALATVYLPFVQNQRPRLTLHVRIAGSATPVIAALIREVHTLDPNLPVNVTTMATQLNRTIALDRLMAMLTSLFGLLAVVVAAVGLYGVMAFSVAARTREIGIRMALGAGRGRLLGQVLGESAVLTAIGILLGLPMALWASRAVGSFLYGLSATDPWTYAAVAMVMSAVTLTAAWIPARRASMVDPMVALRYE